MDHCLWEMTAEDLQFLLMSSGLISDAVWCEQYQILHIEGSFQILLPSQNKQVSKQWLGIPRYFKYNRWQYACTPAVGILHMKAERVSS